jgi:hypothetical protein
LFIERGTRESDRPNASVAAIAQRERFYKLTKLKGQQLKSTLWCSVQYGPWLAIAIEEQSCVEIKSFWQLGIPGMPEVGVMWYGLWTDIPPYPSLTVLANDLVLFKVERFCCPGYTFCPTTMSCLRNEIRCPDVVEPA